MVDAERVPLVPHGDAPLRTTTLSRECKTSWNICMGFVLMSLAVLGMVVTIGSLKGGLVDKAHREVFVNAGDNDTVSGSTMEYDYEVTQPPGLGDPEPPDKSFGPENTEPGGSELDQRAAAVRARVQRRVAFRVANRETAEAAAAAAQANADADANEVAEEGVAEALVQDEAAERQKQDASRQRVRGRERQQAVAREGVSDADGVGETVQEVAEQTVEAVADTQAPAKQLPESMPMHAPVDTTQAPETQLPEPTPAPTPVPTPATMVKADILRAAESALAREGDDESDASSKVPTKQAKQPTTVPTPTPALSPPPPSRPVITGAQGLLDAMSKYDTYRYLPQAPYPPLPPSPPPSPPPPPPFLPRPPHPHPPAHPPAHQPPAAFHSLVPLPGVVAEAGSVNSAPASSFPKTATDGTTSRTTALSGLTDKNSAGPFPSKDSSVVDDSKHLRVDDSNDDLSADSPIGAAEHLGVVSAFWEAPLAGDSGRWHSKRRHKTPQYYRAGLDNLVRLAARSGNSVVLFTAVGSNDCMGLELTYTDGAAAAAGVSGTTKSTNEKPRFLCVKLPLASLHYGDWHLTDHTLVANMPCSSEMRDTKLIWLNKINLMETAAHMLRLPGGAAATRMEWIDADQYAERSDLGDNTGGAGGLGVRLQDVSQWRPIPKENTGDANLGQLQTLVNPQSVSASVPVFDSDPGDSDTKSQGKGKPPNGFKIIKGLVFSFAAKKQLPVDVLDTWQAETKRLVDGFPSLERRDDGGRDAEESNLGSFVTQQASLPLHDRVQMGCYAPSQRVGPCTSNHFVASRFRTSVFGVAKMRQAFEDTIFDYQREFPGPGFDGWSVQNLTWNNSFDEKAKAHDRPGYATHAFMYARDGFVAGKQNWACVCSTEEMVYNKMLRRFPGLFLPDKNCDDAAAYETMEKGTAAGSVHGKDLLAPRHLR